MAIICRCTLEKTHISFSKSLNNCKVLRWISKAAVPISALFHDNLPVLDPDQGNCGIDSWFDVYNDLNFFDFDSFKVRTKERTIMQCLCEWRQTCTLLIDNNGSLIIVVCFIFTSLEPQKFIFQKFNGPLVTICSMSKLK